MAGMVNKRIPCDLIKVGMRFSAPVFFNDGENMFLAEGKTVKAYHVAALKRWAIPYLLSYGHELSDSDSFSAITDIEEVDVLDEVEEFEEVSTESFAS